MRLKLFIKFFLVTLALNAIVLAWPAYHIKTSESMRAGNFALDRASLMAQGASRAFTTAMLEGRGPEFTGILNSLSGKGVRSLELLGPEGKPLGAHSDISMALKPTGGNQWNESLFIDIPIQRQPSCAVCHPGDAGPVMAVLRVTIERPEIAEYDSVAPGPLMFFFVIVLSSLLISAFGTWITSRHACDEVERTGKERDSSLALELKEAEKMAAIGELASSIAHDIKNPLAGISGAIQVFAEEFDPDDSRSGIIREVLGEIERLDRSVKDLLNYARPARPNLMPTPMEGIMERVMRSIKEPAQKNHVDVNIISTAQDAIVHVDPEQIHQALANILAFSLNAMPGGGTLAIAVRSDERTEHVEITVRDTGAGLDMEDPGLVFKPFRISRQQGIGLGLAISKSILERHGGDIAVESSPGSGTAFIVTLPVYR